MDSMGYTIWDVPSTWPVENEGLAWDAQSQICKVIIQPTGGVPHPKISKSDFSRVE